MADFAARTPPKDDEGQSPTSVEFADSEGTVRTLRARDGLFHPHDAEEDRALESAGFEQDADSLKTIEEDRMAAAEKERDAAEKAAAKEAAAAEKAAAAASKASEPDEAATAQPEKQ